MSDEVGDLDELSGVRINERLEGGAGLVVLNLNDVRESNRAIRKSQILERRRVVVDRSTESGLCGLDRIFHRNSGLGRRNSGW